MSISKATHDALSQVTGINLGGVLDRCRLEDAAERGQQALVASAEVLQ